MRGSGTQITRLLPGNVWDALLGANAPSASNVFATMADIGSVTTIYSGDGTFGVNRVGTLTDTLNFVTAGTGGISIGPTPFTTTHTLEVRANGTGRFILFRGSSSSAGQVFQIANLSQTLATFNNNGFISIAPNAISNHILAVGLGTSATAKVTITGIGNTSATINQQWRNSALSTLMQLNDDGHLGLGITPTTTDKSLIQGIGTSNTTTAQRWVNSTPTELMRIMDNGVLCIGTNTDATAGLGTAKRFNAYAIVANDYTVNTVVDQSYQPTSNNSNTAVAEYVRLTKENAFNTLEIKATISSARNDGTGNITYMYGHEGFIWSVGNANINSAFAYSARSQMQAGTVTNFGGVDVSFQEALAGTITNMIGVLVRTPTNVTAPTITNTFGVLLQGNSIGANNYGFISASQNTNAFGTITPNQNALAVFTSTTKAPIMLTPMTAAQASAITAANGMAVYVSDTDGTFLTPGFWKFEEGGWLPW